MDAPDNDLSGRVAEWFAVPCPADEWVYRGQPAEYSQLYPSVTRDRNQELFGNRLYNIEPRVACDILDASPVLRLDRLLVSDFSAHINLDREHSTAFLPEPNSATISLAAFFNALAQHYGFPTLLVDLTLDPWVALSFATQKYSRAGYQFGQRPGRLLRWPARRISATRLQIDIGGEGPEPSRMELFDISKCSPHLRRPSLQSSVLAVPIIAPTFNPSVFTTPGAGMLFPLSFNDLRLVDMLSIESTESFLVDANATEGFASVAPSMDALFPDIVDLGFSYLSVIGLVSLTAMPRDPLHELVTDKKHKQDLETCSLQYADTLKAAAALLERECFRLVPGVRLSTELSRNTRVAFSRLRAQSETAADAAKMIDSPESFRLLHRLQRELSLRMLEELNPDAAKEIRESTSKDTFVRFDYSTERLEVGQMKSASRNVHWIRDEILSRLTRVETLAEHAGMVPAYAVENREEHASLFNTLDASHDYEELVHRHLCAVRRFRPTGDLFSPFETESEQVNE